METIKVYLRQISQNPFWIFVIVACVVPMVTLGVMLWIEAVNVPHWDDWLKAYPIVVQTLAGTLTIADIFQQYGPSRYVLTNLITVLSVHLTNWNIELLAWFHYLIIFALFGLVVSLYHRVYPHLTPYAAVAFAFLLFSLRQRQALLWTFQGYMYYISLLFLCGVWLLSHPAKQWRHLVGASLCAGIALFTYPTGWMLPPLFLIGLWFWQYRKWQHFLFWIASSGLWYALYFNNYVFRSTETELETLGTYLHFFVLYMVNPLFQQPLEHQWLAFVVFIVSIIMVMGSLVYLYRKDNNLEGLTTFVVMGLFTAGAALLTAQGRAGAIYLEQRALASRYVVHGTYYWLLFAAVTIPTVWYTVRSQHTRERYAGGLYIFLTVPILWVFLNNAGWDSSRVLVPTHLDHEARMLEFQIKTDYDYDDFLSLLIQSQESRNDIFEYLIENDLSAFGDRVQIINLRAVPLEDLESFYQPHYRPAFIPNYDARSGMWQPAPSIAEQTFFVPQAETILFASEALIVPPRPNASNILQSDGVVFLISIVTEEGIQQTYRTSYIPNEDVEPKPITLDLTPYMGQTVTLRYETQILGHRDYDHSAWINPRIVVYEYQRVSPNTEWWEAIELSNP